MLGLEMLVCVIVIVDSSVFVAIIRVENLHLSGSLTSFISYLGGVSQDGNWSLSLER